MEIDEMIAVLKAFDEGAEIEYKFKNKEWVPYPQTMNKASHTPTWDFSEFDYRIKKIPTYRPFVNMEEVMEAVKEHGTLLTYKSKECRVMLNITEFNDGCIWYGNAKAAGEYFADVFNEMTFADGTPFGKLEI